LEYFIIIIRGDVLDFILSGVKNEYDGKRVSKRIIPGKINAYFVRVLKIDNLEDFLFNTYVYIIRRGRRGTRRRGNLRKLK